jgi:hypothetical protein
MPIGAEARTAGDHPGLWKTGGGECMYIVFEAAGVFLNKTTGRFDHGGYGRDKEAELVARAKVSIGGISTRSGHPPSMAQSRRFRPLAAAACKESVLPKAAGVRQ